MSAAKPKTFFAGAGLVWRRQRVLWWIFIVNFCLAFFATRSMVARAGEALNHSLDAVRLVHGFDASAISEIALQPESLIGSPRSEIFLSSLVFVVFMLFITGGVIATYFRDQNLRTGAFFEACGYHFWRFFRLMIYFLLMMIPVGILMKLTGTIYTRIDAQSISPFPAVHFFEVAAIVILLILMKIRLWFDMAQVIAIADDEPRMHKALRSSASLLWHNFGSLFWLYFRITVVAWVGFGVVLQFWKNRMNPESIGGAFFVSQLLIIFWLALRLWQRASEALWYRRYQAQATSVSVPLPEAFPPPRDPDLIPGPPLTSPPAAR